MKFDSGFKSKEFAFFTQWVPCQLKGMLMWLTLILFYYPGIYLLFSCSLLMVDAAVVKSASLPEHHTEPVSTYNNSYYHQYDHLPQPQANDIFTALTHSQGRINEHAINHGDARVGSTYNTTEAIDLHEELQLSTKSLVLLNKQHHAFFPTMAKAETAKAGDEQRKTHNYPRKTEQLSPEVTTTCMDEEGNSVSWFIAYKLPQIPSGQDPLVQQGTKYYFLTDVNKDSWVESHYPINSNQSILATTMQILWEKNGDNTSSPDIAKIAYNDQPPSEPAVVMNGHTKGVVWASMNAGVWLQHSCPHFPNLVAGDFASSYPQGGLINGQMFLCMSLGNVSSVDVVGSVLQYTRPLVYNHSIPTSMQNLIPELRKVAEKNATVRKAPWFNTFQLEAGKLQLQVHAKGPKFRREIYSTWIAPEYGTGLDVQSWLNGAHPYMSNCTSGEFSVWNILLKNMSSQNFSSTDDHSKWAVSTNKEKHVTCVGDYGDLNRMKPQRTRGGVTICVSDPLLWSAFKSLVKEVQPCNSTSLKSYMLRKSWRNGREETA